MDSEKVCTWCGVLLPLDQFFRRPTGYLRSQCKRCHNRKPPRNRKPKTRWDLLSDRLRHRRGSKPLPAPGVRVLREQLGEPVACHLCGGPLGWDTAEIDHLVSYAQGGTNDADNLGWIHRTCNHIKGPLPVTELLPLLKQILAHHHHVTDTENPQNAPAARDVTSNDGSGILEVSDHPRGDSEMTPAVYQSRLVKTEATIAAGAIEVFATHRSWRFAHRRADNHPFFMIDGTPSKRAGVVVAPTYWVDLHACTCDSHRKGGWACKHIRAVRLWFEAVKAGEISIPGRMTSGDRVVLEAEHAENAAMDVAASADVLLDTYHAEQARARAARCEEPEQPWWLTPDGGIVWLQDGDRIGLDTGTLREVGTGAGTCQQPGCDEPCVPHEPWCERHVLVDAF